MDTLNYILRAKIIDGKLKFLEPERYIQCLKTFRGKYANQLEVVLRKIRKPRSNPQNRYYWGVVINLIANELGYTPDDAHYALREKFLTLGGKEGLQVPKSTTDLSTKEFEEYTERIRQWAVEFLNINIPEPNEVE